MAFVRIKKVKNKQYAYLVENTWSNGRSKQAVKQYLGPVVHAQELPAPEIPPDTAAQHIIKLLLAQELKGAAVKHTKTTIRRNKKPVTVALNGGFLCDYTLRKIQHALNVTEEETPGTLLANSFAQAGLRIPQHAFITLYTSHR